MLVLKLDVFDQYSLSVWALLVGSNNDTDGYSADGDDNALILPPSLCVRNENSETIGNLSICNL